MTHPAIHVANIGKRYRLGLTHADSLSELASGLTRRLSDLVGNRPLQRDSDGNSRVSKRAEFWALREISFDLAEGEVLGVIGRNGAGKSTLLKLVSRVTSPTVGRIDVWGKVASLLEVGTGFHPDLTGRENVYMNATLLGMTRREVTRKLDQIVEFAGVADFLDTQVKRYSSGMKVRLGFAVAAHLEPDILIVDEVLAVGDAEFQKKCLGKMQSVATGGRTVLFVSHNMGAIRKLCSKGLLLDAGEMVSMGSTDDVVSDYLSLQGTQLGFCKEWRNNETIEFDQQTTIRPRSFAAQNNTKTPLPNFATSEPITLSFNFLASGSLSGIRIGVLIRNADYVTLFGSNMSLPVNETYKTPQLIEAACVIPNQLLNRGTYTVDLGVDRPPQHIGTFLDQESIRFSVTDVDGHGVAAEPLPGVVRPNLQWSMRVH